MHVYSLASKNIKRHGGAKNVPTVVDLEDHLSNWTIRSARVRKIGESLRALQREAADIYNNAVAMSDENMGGHLESTDVLRLAKHARELQKTARHVNGYNSFDQLAARQFIDDLGSLDVYLRWVGDPFKFFRVASESKITRRSVISLVDRMLLPQLHDESQHDTPAAVRPDIKYPALRGLAHRASIAAYHRLPPEAVRERRDLLKPYTDVPDVSSGSVHMHIYYHEMLKLREASMRALASFGLITEDERSTVLQQNIAADELDRLLDLAALNGNYTDFVREGVPQLFRDIAAHGRKPLFRHRMGWASGLYSYADGSVNDIAMRDDLLLISQEPGTGNYRVFRGDAFWTAVHENLHILHWARSKGMPAGLDNDPMGLSWANFAHVEGVTTWGESAIALSWLAENYESLDMTADDLRATQLRNVDRDKFLRSRLFFRTHALVDLHSAAANTFRDTKNAVHRSDANFPQEKLHDLLFLHTYDLGGAQLHELFNEIREREEERQGSREAAENFIQEHFPYIARGVFTGGWSLKGLNQWMHGHYLPRLYKAIKSNPGRSSASASANVKEALRVGVDSTEA